MARSDMDLAGELLGRLKGYQSGRFLALFGDDRARAARALWACFDELSAANILDNQDALALLAAGAAEVAGLRALTLFQKVATEPNRTLRDPAYGSKTQPYAGWSTGLEQIVRRLADRQPLIDAWAGLPPPVGPALGFALARLGDLPGSALGAKLLRLFATRAAERYTWCADGFEGAERAWGEAVWRRAVVEAAADPAVTRVGMWASHFAPYAPYASDDQLFAIAPKLTWGEAAIAEFFWDRGPQMDARLEAYADAVRAGAPPADVRNTDLLVALYARNLLHLGRELPERFDPLVAALLGRSSHPAALHHLLRVLPAARRDPLLLDWAERLELRASDDYAVLASHPTPALARWAVGRLAAGAENFWLENNLAALGAETVAALDELPDILALETRALWAALGALREYPSPRAARLAARLLDHPEVGGYAATVLAVQALPDMVALARAALDGPNPSANAVAALARRFFDPEIRALAADLAPRLPRQFQRDLQLALKPLPGPVSAFVERVRAEESAGADAETPLLRLYRAAIAGHAAIIRQLPPELLAEDDEARWFCVCCVWRGEPHLLRPLAEAAGPRLVAPLAALWRHPPLLRRIADSEGRAAALATISAFDLAALLDLLPRAALRANAALRGPLRAGLQNALDQPDLRGRALAGLRSLLDDRLRRRVALEVLAGQSIPELADVLATLAPGNTTEQRLIERARDLARVAALPIARLPAQALAELACVEVGPALAAAVGAVALAGAVLAAATASELVLLDRAEGRLRSRIADIGSRDHWWLAPAGDWLAVLDDGVKLIRASGDDGAWLYPNDGIAGAQPLSNDRLLVWAIGHNVYDPLTLYEAPAGRELASPAIEGFAGDARPLDDIQFVLLAEGGSVELRATLDGALLRTLGRAPLRDDDWAALRVVAGGEALLVVAESGTTPLVRQTDGKYARMATIAADPALVIAHGDCPFFAVLGAETTIFGSDGALRGRLALPSGGGRLAALAQQHYLVVAVDATLWRFDLERMQADARLDLPAAITALAGDGAGWAAGTAAGRIITSG